MATARLRGVPPSEVLGVGCSWCAYCLDEALLVREAARDRRLGEEATSDRKQQDADAHYDATGRVKF